MTNPTPTKPTNSDVEQPAQVSELDEILSEYGVKLGLAITQRRPDAQYVGQEAIAKAKASITALLERKEREARLDELGRAAPHQVSHYFEIAESELNASWYLEYCVARREQLNQSNSEESV